MRRVLTVIVAMCLAAPVVTAGELAGVTMADSVKVGDASLVLNGQGLRKKLWIKVYVAGLYLEAPARDAESAIAAPGAKRIVMHFLTDKATKSKMDGAWREGFEENTPGAEKSLGPQIEKFIGFFGDMHDGDEIALTMVPNEGTTVALNGTVKGTIEGSEFATALLKVWLGSSPPSDDLKDGMLGG
jgi:hypothetical protein